MKVTYFVQLTTFHGNNWYSRGSRGSQQGKSILKAQQSSYNSRPLRSQRGLKTVDVTIWGWWSLEGPPASHGHSCKVQFQSVLGTPEDLGSRVKNSY